MNAYDVITNRIIELMEQGVVPWRKPWTNAGAPKNLKSGKEYNGINVFMLSASGYALPYWLTYKQTKERGGYVKRGEKGFPVVFWKWLDAKENETEAKRVPMLRYYTVFNVEQCGGVEAPAITENIRPFNPIAQCESVVSAMPNKPAIEHQEQRAYYRPLTDTVNMPNQESFSSEPGYYSTLFHELAHATGHKRRLNRSGIADISSFGSHSYSKEELIAEMGAAYLCGHCGIETATIENSAAYITGWLQRLRNNKKLVIMAAAQAQKASDYILEKKPNNKGK